VPVALVESLDREGRGVARAEGKAVFIAGALPGERVEYTVHKRKSAYDAGALTRLLHESAARVSPRCPPAPARLAPASICARVGARVLGTLARRQVGQSMLPPIHGPAWGSSIARLSAYCEEGRALVGFRGAGRPMSQRCARASAAAVSALIVPLRALIGVLSIRERLPQIEVAVGEEVVVLVLRILDPLTPADEDAIRAFADDHRVQIWLQPAGPNSARPFHPLDAPPLYYRLQEFDVRIRFGPADFTQVNQAVNGVLVRRAMQLLAPAPGNACWISSAAWATSPSRSPARRNSDRHRGQHLTRRAGAGERAANRLAADFVVGDLFDAATCARLPAATRCLSTRRARERSRWSRRSGTTARRGSSTSPAIRRRSRATPACSST
jgi:23S rRNA (uracil1939-C5)-methyltransferase